MDRGGMGGVTAQISTVLGPGRVLPPRVGAVCPVPLLGKRLKVES